MAQSDGKKDDRTRNNCHNEEAATDGAGFDFLFVIVHLTKGRPTIHVGGVLAIPHLKEF